MKKMVLAIQPSEKSAITPSKSAMKASKGSNALSTKNPTNIPPMSETITSFVIIAKAIVNSGIAIDNIPYSISTKP